MTIRTEQYDQPLDRAAAHARKWLTSLADRPVGPRMTADQLAGAFGGSLPPAGHLPELVIDELAAHHPPEEATGADRHQTGLSLRGELVDDQFGQVPGRR